MPGASGEGAARGAAWRGEGRWRPVWRGLALLVALACAGFFASEAARCSQSLARLSFTPQLLFALAGALLLQFASSLLDGWSWFFLLRMLKVEAGAGRSIGIFSLAQFGKYLPGNVAQHVGRLLLARRAGWPGERAALSLLIENAFAVGAGAVLAGAGLAGSAAGDLGALLSAAALTLAWLAGTSVLRALLARPPRLVRERLSLDEPLLLPLRDLLLYFAVHLASYAAMGGALALLLRGLSGAWPAELWMVPTAVAASWLAGYLVPGAPAGLGVREALLALLLVPSNDAAAVVAAAFLWRAVSLSSDALLAASGALLTRRLGRQGAARESA